MGGLKILIGLALLSAGFFSLPLVVILMILRLYFGRKNLSPLLLDILIALFFSFLIFFFLYGLGFFPQFGPFPNI